MCLLYQSKKRKELVSTAWHSSDIHRATKNSRDAQTSYNQVLSRLPDSGVIVNIHIPLEIECSRELRGVELGILCGKQLLGKDTELWHARPWDRCSRLMRYLVSAPAAQIAPDQVENDVCAYQ